MRQFLVFLLFGKSLAAVKLVNLILAFVTAWIITRIARRFSSRNTVILLSSLLFLFHPAIIFAESGSIIGAMQIGGTSSPSQIPFFIASCDYTLIGEELFAAKGYIDKEPASLGSLLGLDLLRAILIGLIILVWLSGNAGIQGLINFLKM